MLAPPVAQEFEDAFSQAVPGPRGTTFHSGRGLYPQARLELIRAACAAGQPGPGLTWITEPPAYFTGPRAQALKLTVATIYTQAVEAELTRAWTLTRQLGAPALLDVDAQRRIQQANWQRDAAASVVYDHLADERDPARVPELIRDRAHQAVTAELDLSVQRSLGGKTRAIVMVLGRARYRELAEDIKAALPQGSHSDHVAFQLSALSRRPWSQLLGYHEEHQARLAAAKPAAAQRELRDTLLSFAYAAINIPRNSTTH